MKSHRVFHLLPLIFFVYCFALPVMLVSADSFNDSLSWTNVFNSHTDYISAGLDTRPNTPPDNYIVSGVPETYTYCFCAGRCQTGVAFFTDSDTLIATGGGLHDRVFFSVPSGKHIQAASFRIQDGLTVWSLSSTNVIFCGATSPEYFGNVIFRNDCNIVNSAGDDLSPPMINEKFRFSLSAWSDYSIRGYADTNTENEFRVEFYIAPSSSSAADFSVSEIYQLMSDLSDAFTSGDETSEDRIKNAIREEYPIIYTLLEEGKSQFELVKSEVTQSMSVSSPIVDGIEYSVELLQKYNLIINRSYYGYRGFGGRYIGTTGADFNFNVINFYANVRNSPNYYDLNDVYAVFYTATESEAPVCILKQTFRVSDFFPTLHVPDMTLPDSDVIDGVSPYPDGGSDDWTIYQHAMYMRYLLDQFDRDISISFKNYGESFKLPDHTYDYDSTDLVPYDFDTSVPDISAPDGLPLDLVRPVSFLGTLWSHVLDSTGLTVIIPWCMIIGLVAWFFYGKN